MEEASNESFLLPAKKRRPTGHCPEGATEHRLEAYAPLAFQTVERSPRAIPGAIAVPITPTLQLLRYSTSPLLRHFRPHSRATSCTHSSSTFRY